MNDNVVNADHEAELETLILEQSELASKIEACKKAGRDAALEKVKSLCKAYDISAFDLRGSLKKPTIKVVTGVKKKKLKLAQANADA